MVTHLVFYKMRLFSLPAEQHPASQEKFYCTESYCNGTSGYKFYTQNHCSENTGLKNRNMHKNWSVSCKITELIQDERTVSVNLCNMGSALC